MIDNLSQNSYDAIPYPSYPFPETHPDHLATIATLLGMSPAPVSRCRVLELGCASGGNLIPMAYSFPHSEFVGIDLSARQIAAGQPMITDLGLQNITLRQLDILDVGPELGRFDYIIAHGVFAWVPPPVQEKILQICQQHLAPDGVAYISYNTYPGWRIRSAIRDMMLYHTRTLDNPQERIAKARELLDFLVESIQSDNNIHGDFLHSYVTYVRERLLPEAEDAYLFHEELAEVNEPLYFYQFAQRIANHGLSYLGDARFHTMLAANLPPKVAETLRTMANDTVALEQYLDFIQNRTFRRSLLCHQTVRLSGKLTPDRLRNFYVASPTRPKSAQEDGTDAGQDWQIDLGAGLAETFVGPDGKTLATDHPLTKAAMAHLMEIWPRAVAFDDLVMAAYSRLQQELPPEQAAGSVSEPLILGANLLKAFGTGDTLVELHVSPSQFVGKPAERPVASAVARWLARRGPEVTNLRHEPVKLHPFVHHLLPYLDGSKDRTALLTSLNEMLAAGAIQVEQEEKLVEDAAEAIRLLPEMLDSSLQSLADAALLVA